MYFTYILHSDSLNQFYVGQTSDIKNRMTYHNKGSVRSTKRGKPWKLVEVIVVETRREALILERSIKKRGTSRFLNDLQIKIRDVAQPG